MTTSVAVATLHLLLLVPTTRLLLRLAVPVLVFLAWTPIAHAWSWPVRGAVLQPFVYDAAHPYASGQHRGIDIGAAAAGENVAAPEAGTVSFAGTVPTSGESVTIETPDGYSVTLTHLGSIVVSKGATVAEGDTVGAVGPSGTPEVDGPYVHLGIRLTADQNGYLDPLGLLPPPTTESPPTDSTTTVSQPSASGGATAAAPTASAAASTSAPLANDPPANMSHAGTRGANIRSRPHVSHHARGRAQEARADARPHRSPQRQAAHPALSRGPAQHAVRRSDQHDAQPTSSSSRPILEGAVPREPVDLAAGRELPPRVHVAPTTRTEPHGRTSGALVPLFCNTLAALVAVGAALAAGRRRRGHARTSPTVEAQILHLPPQAFDPLQREAA